MLCQKICDARVNKKKACQRLTRQRGVLSSLSSCDTGIELEGWNNFANRYQDRESASNGERFDRMMHPDAGFELKKFHSSMFLV